MALLRETGAGLEIYLVERSPQLRFFGGYWALPGGVRDRDDIEAAGGDGDLGLRYCGARELFEETGVLLRCRDSSRALRQVARRALLAGDPAPYRALTSWDEEASALLELCKIRTPPFAPVRYDTLFALALLPDGEAPEIWPGELVDGRFWRPADALAAWHRGEVAIVPPVIIVLEHLVDRDVEGFRRALAATAGGYRAGKLHRVRFSPGIVMASVATPTLPPATTTNCLIVGERTLYVVDPGAPDADEQERLFDLLDELRREGRSLAAILMTHHHPDHSGAVEALSERYQLAVSGHCRTLDRLAPARRGRELADGDRIELGTAPDGSDGWHLEVLFTPGHAKGHLCFRDSRYRALIAGDMVSTVSTIVIDPPEGHMQTYLDSLQRLAEQSIDVLYPAHGPAVRNGRRLVEHFLRHRRARQEKIAGALAQQPTRLEELVKTVYDDVDSAMHGHAARSLLAGLQLLEEQGLASRSGEKWRAMEPSPDDRRP